MHRVCAGVCAQGVRGGVLRSVCKRGFLCGDVCGGGVGSSCAACEYSSCRVCMAGRCVEMCRWGCVRECICRAFLQGLCAGVGCYGSSVGEGGKAFPEGAGDARGKAECIPVSREDVGVPVPECHLDCGRKDESKIYPSVWRGWSGDRLAPVELSCQPCLCLGSSLCSSGCCHGCCLSWRVSGRPPG